MQFAGAAAGVKGGEYNNVILALTDTSTISLKRLFDGMVGEFKRLENGFQCYDSFSEKVETVKAPIALVFCDLPAKAEVTPFKGYQADVFCPRDMYNKKSGAGFDVKRDINLLMQQIADIDNQTSLARKKVLGVRYGLDVNNLESIVATLDKFDLTKDFPSDILHHFLLGWGKKSYIFFKNEVLSAEALDQLCHIFDQLIWNEYKSRTNSNALKKAGSQIGRNIKALLQVLWYGIWILIKTDPAKFQADLEVFLRAFFYLGKLNYLFFNEHEVGWSPAIVAQADDAIRTAVAIFRRDMVELVPGPKTHDLEHHIQEDILRHGNPAGFDCQAGEAKMKVQKLCNNFSNKLAPGKDVAMKYMKTEIVRHIVMGGALSDDGILKAAPKVLEEVQKCTSIKSLLGLDTGPDYVGEASLFDYEVSSVGKRRIKLRKPEYEHVNLGVPNVLMKTCRKVETPNGPLFRNGGLYRFEGAELKMAILVEVYKS